MLDVYGIHCDEAVVFLLNLYVIYAHRHDFKPAKAVVCQLSKSFVNFFSVYNKFILNRRKSSRSFERVIYLE